MTTEERVARLDDARLAIVPIEPTEAMIAVGQQALFEEETVSYIWRAMIAEARK